MKMIVQDLLNEVWYVDVIDGTDGSTRQIVVRAQRGKKHPFFPEIVNLCFSVEQAEGFITWFQRITRVVKKMQKLSNS